MRRLVLVVGARPNFIKAAPILDALREYPDINVTLVHTGQHYDAQLSDVFFEELHLRTPDIHLQVGSGSHAVQTGRVMERFEEYLQEERSAGRPVDRVVVLGDVNSTLACTLVASKMQIPVAHVEAGLRSFDRSMPEEINRIVTDSLADLLLCSEPAGVENLRREGRTGREIHLVGNVMIDTLLENVEKAQNRSILEELNLLPGGYGVVTLHRPANVDDPNQLRRLVRVLVEVSRQIPLVFAVHPRTARALEEAKLQCSSADSQILMLGPQGYLDFLSLTSQAKLVMTDSGGLQEETTAIGIPCLTLRPNTERPITIYEGTSTLVGSDVDQLRDGVEAILDGDYPNGRCPELWDGRAGQRIARILADALALRPAITTPSFQRAA
ncbi:UDP-N-acetylglucosamine 2-epimerase (non-hydrolyzing) [bacterium]|nr:UDP-N-acetylglucosamine 2-epimerase (non-hydrolyzing) [bacterium]